MALQDLGAEDLRVAGRPGPEVRDFKSGGGWVRCIKLSDLDEWFFGPKGQALQTVVEALGPDDEPWFALAGALLGQHYHLVVFHLEQAYKRRGERELRAPSPIPGACDSQSGPRGHEPEATEEEHSHIPGACDSQSGPRGGASEATEEEHSHIPGACDSQSGPPPPARRRVRVRRRSRSRRCCSRRRRRAARQRSDSRAASPRSRSRSAKARRSDSHRSNPEVCPQSRGRASGLEENERPSRAGCVPHQGPDPRGQSQGGGCGQEGEDPGACQWQAQGPGPWGGGQTWQPPTWDRQWGAAAAQGGDGHWGAARRQVGHAAAKGGGGAQEARQNGAAAARG
jgi:hypothetical protein